MDGEELYVPDDERIGKIMRERKTLSESEMNERETFTH
jgi:hypothetical protein